MIIAQRSVSLNYGTDSVALSVRSAFATRADFSVVQTEVDARGKAPLDLSALYPALYAPTRRPAALTRSLRAFVFRLSVLGSAAAGMVMLMRH